MIFNTTYIVDGYRKYGTHVHASTEAEAKKFAKQRGLGETIDGLGGRNCNDERASKIIRSRKSIEEKIHAICWVANLALASGVGTREELIGDTGVLHELLHNKLFGVSYGGGPPMHVILKLLIKIENKIPGYCK